MFKTACGNALPDKASCVRLGLVYPFVNSKNAITIPAFEPPRVVITVIIPLEPTLAVLLGVKIV